MQLVYYRKQVPNFGDDLNTFLWRQLAPDLFDYDLEAGFVGIGTIIGMPCGDVRRLHVFSSGVGYDRPERWRDKQVEYWCVRGPLTARILGLPADRAITDGAMLVPQAEGFPAAATGSGGVAIVPHWETLEHPGWMEAAALADYELIDPRGDPRGVIARIAAAGLVLTESLHGAILADVYGIPWIAFATSKNLSVTKWTDWTLSVGCNFTVTMVPPPDPGPVIAFGRTPAPFGQIMRFDAEAAMAEFERRLAPAATPPETMRSQLKSMVKQSRLLRPLFGLSPARTAEALERLTRTEPTLSAEPLRRELRDRMLERLAALQTAYRLASAA